MSAATRGNRATAASEREFEAARTKSISSRPCARDRLLLDPGSPQSAASERDLCSVSRSLAEGPCHG